MGDDTFLRALIAYQCGRLKNLVRKWRRRADDNGPLAARAYLDAANDLENVLKVFKKELMAQPGNPEWGLLDGISEQEKRNMP